MAYFLQQAANGLFPAAIYGLLAYGYTLTFAVTRRANLAHGALFALLGQITILATVFSYRIFRLELWAALIFGIALAAAFAWVISQLVSRHVFEPLARQSPNAMIAATLALMIVFLELGRIASDARDFWLPPMLAAPATLLSSGGIAITLTAIQLLAIAASLAALGAANLFIRRSAFGKHWNAMAQDPLAASLCGIDPKSTLIRTVLVSSGLTLIAAVLAAVYYGNVSFGEGLTYGLKILLISAAGGFASPLVSAIGAAGVAIAESLWTGYFPADWRDGVIYGALVLLLVLRRSGKLPV